MPHDVIISYATVDKLTADAVCAKLEEQGIRCWIAPRDIIPGADFAEAIVNAIDRARLTILILSSHANLSKHVMREAKRSMEAGIPIIPFRIEDVQPNKSLEYYIGAQHWLDAMTPPLERHIQKLAEVILIFLSKPTSPLQDVSPQPAAQSRSSAKVHPSRHTLKLSAIVALIAIVIATGTYYGMINTSTITNEKPVQTSPQGVTTLASRSLVSYKNPGLGLGFTYPENWTVGKIGPNFTTLYYQISPIRWDDNSTSMWFYKENKKFYAGTNDTETARNKVDYMASYANNSSQFSDVRYVQNATLTKLGGFPAYQFTASYNHTPQTRDPQRMGLQIWTCRGDYVYGITYIGRPDYFNRSLSDAKQIINSFVLDSSNTV